MFDANIRNKLCEFMSVNSLLNIRKINKQWKQSVESFMLTTLLNRYGIKSLFLSKYSSCQICEVVLEKKHFTLKYGPSHTMGIKEYSVCKKCKCLFNN